MPREAQNRQDLMPQGGASLGTGSSQAVSTSWINKLQIADALDGSTLRASEIAAGIRSGDIEVNILGDRLFNHLFDATYDGYSWGDQIYLRASRGSNLLGDAVH